ncbi:hypothetical protein J437_LFUL008296 [Ladona fulva]|uniref:Phospholipase A2 n=1 Tax=Ladona fulva TaxID=123851 RepID=A0A8K0K7H0_LADFU|nr:hypothetical protein J437_LFUL008296 [Ladona fulva]
MQFTEMELDDSNDKVEEFNREYKATIDQRITSRIWEFDKLDPYQIFKELQAIPSDHSFDMNVFKPSPYLILHLKGTPNEKKRTPIEKNSRYPQWNVCFQFIVDPLNMKDLHITLMDKRLVFDRKIGTKRVKISNMKLDTEDRFILEFKEGSKVYIQFSLVRSRTQDLRFSLALSKGEIEFVKKRRRMVYEGMQRFLEDSAPKEVREVPVVAILGSGGGIRAVTANAGVFKALYESGLLDCAMYVAGLSGTSWYLTYLYTHPDFPKYVGPGDLIPDIRKSIAMDWKKILTIKNARIYVSQLLKKVSKGQSISFTDIYGHILGEMLLGKRMHLKLSDLKEKLTDGAIPMPLFTCVVAKDNVSALAYQEYVEFSPYEVGLPKYGVFMKTKNFGSKFYVGKIIKNYGESPFHYLIAIWGSAFSILFRRLVEEEKKKWGVKNDAENLTHEDMDKFSTTKSGENVNERSNIPLLRQDMSLSALKNALENLIPEDSNSVENFHTSIGVDGSIPESQDFATSDHNGLKTSESTESLLKATEKSFRRVSFTPNEYNFRHNLPSNRKRSVIPMIIKEEMNDNQLIVGRNSQHEGELFTKYSADDSSINPSYYRRKTLLQDIRNETLRRINKASQATWRARYWSNFLDFITNTKIIGKTRTGRAGEIFNPLLGLNLTKKYPISPSFGRDEDFQHYGTLIDSNEKTLCLVDAGLVFNSPFPLLLRPQRAVDVFISFDYSARAADFHEPFRELLLAEKWAIKNKVLFPPIEKLVQRYYDEPLREVYVFKHPDNPYCPLLVHCIIFNGQFKEYKLPDVKRETPEEFEFADFRIFSDPENPYSSFNYTYTPLQFDRMCKLMEFNTLKGMEVFRKVLKYAVKRKKKLLEI